MLLENTSENPSNSPILDPGFTQGVLSNRPCPSVDPSACWSVGQSVFKYLRDLSLFFLIFCMKLEHHKSTKVTEPDY